MLTARRERNWFYCPCCGYRISKFLFTVLLQFPVTLLMFKQPIKSFVGVGALQQSWDLIDVSFLYASRY